MTAYAFPRQLPTGEWPPDEAYASVLAHAGMTLRDYFAAQAIQSTVWNYAADVTALPTYMENVAKTAYALADAMLKARET